MLVTIHQPESLPWLGYFSKMDSADLYIVLTDCQYEKDYYQNRNRIRRESGLEYLTVPVVKKDIHLRKINEVRIAGGEWRRKYLNVIKATYSKAPYYENYIGDIEGIINNSPELLWELNMSIILKFREWLGVDTPLLYSHDLDVTSSGSRRNADLVRAVGGDEYLSGPSGRDYLDMNDFNGIDVVYHDYKHPVYKQMHEPFITHASTLDLLMNCGRESIDVIRSGFQLTL